jgi:hypothetical protein
MSDSQSRKNWSATVTAAALALLGSSYYQGPAAASGPKPAASGEQSHVPSPQAGDRLHGVAEPMERLGQITLPPPPPPSVPPFEVSPSGGTVHVPIPPPPPPPPR